MDTKAFNKLRKIVYDQSGIDIKEGKKTMVSSRIAKRLRALNLENEFAYVEYLERTNEEVVQLLDVISTNVTAFYREAHHFQMVRDAMDTWLAQGQTRYRLWSSACSSGEEPYTLAMTMLDAAKSAKKRIDVKILATDISTQILEEAKAGLYPASRADAIPTAQRNRYMVKEGDHFRVSDELKKIVVFRRMNLSKPPMPMKGPMDFIFCRNVMIYFDQPVREGLVHEFHRLIRPDGILMIGHAESLNTLGHLFERSGTSAYRPVNKAMTGGS